MATINQTATKYSQPRGKAVLDIKKYFTKIEYNDNKKPNPCESLSPAFMKTVVTNCERFALATTDEVDVIFETSLIGVRKYIKYLDKCIDDATKLFEKVHTRELSETIAKLLKDKQDVNHNINDLVLPYLRKLIRENPKPRELSTSTIRVISYLSQFDCMESTKIENCLIGFNTRRIDNDTFENIQLYVQRSIEFFTDNDLFLRINVPYLNAFGYSEKVTAGRADLVCDDALIDVKMSKTDANNKTSLELFMEYVMATHTGISWFKNLKRIVIWNPRTNTGWLCDTEDIPKEQIELVENDVVEYAWSLPSNPCSDGTNDPESQDFLCNEWDFK